MKELKKYELELLAEGNTYEFSHQVLKRYPDVCERAGFTFGDAVNSYKARTDFSEGIFILWAQDGTKFLFDSKMNFVGAKAY